MKRILLTGLSLALGIVVFSSFEYNVTNFAGNCTGSNGSSASCSGSGCHFSSSQSDLNVFIVMTDASNGDTITGSYIPDHNYLITLRGTHSAGGGGSYSAYGLQFSTGKVNDGTFTMVNNNLKNIVVGQYEYIEHKQPLAPLGPSGAYFQDYFLWKAPPPGAGTITFYCTMLAGNGDHTINGDIDKNASIIFTEGTTAVKDLANIVTAQLYPNPATSEVHLEMDVKESGEYSISMYNLSGQKISTEKHAIRSGTFSRQFSTAHLNSGMYFMELKKGNRYQVISFIKQ